jgi:hypothetical protein
MGTHLERLLARPASIVYAAAPMRQARHTGVCSAERVPAAHASAKSFAGWAAFAISCVLAGCQPGIGDACSTALQCSSSGSRLCDLTQPHGYCTLVGCDEGTCPSEAVCVKFWPKVPMQSDADRLGTNFCMYKCNSNSDCRNGDGYTCASEQNFGAMDESQVLGDPNQRFCALRSHPVSPDAGTDSGAGAAGSDANMSVEDSGPP